jgi:hypothetical protein
VLSYVRNAWGNRAPFIDPARVSTIRKAYRKRSELFTEQELKGMQAAEALTLNR